MTKFVVGETSNVRNDSLEVSSSLLQIVTLPKGQILVCLR